LDKSDLKIVVELLSDYVNHITPWIKSRDHFHCSGYSNKACTCMISAEKIIKKINDELGDKDE